MLTKPSGTPATASCARRCSSAWPSLALGVRHRGVVGVEHPALEQVGHEHLVTGGAQPLGGVEDAGTDPEDGVDEHDVGHVPTQAAPTDTVQRQGREERLQVRCGAPVSCGAGGPCHPG